MGEVSRAGYYRHLAECAPARADADLRETIQTAALRNRSYGYRRIGTLLRREGTPVNNKRILRLMREDNLLCQRQAPFVPRTTDSRHDKRVWPNLVHHCIPTTLDQIWVADITYIRLLEDFAYLAVILDAFSRKAVGWALDGHLMASLAIEALDMAIVARKPPPGQLIHHSDQGVQYASLTYVERLEKADIAPSMSARGNPYHNAKAESFMKTLKVEQVNAQAYRNLHEARRDIGHFIDVTYNQHRLHSALGYRPPVEFEAMHLPKHRRNA
ncbi:transposase InsO family protein [Labrys wisconsinensis]|uniref:Transposase InsO family protein n=1 Tax=Labrys wisconsinensis TaxID=425677 RepID=A0ABU0IYX4_9HYPH|nr:transposase InsO family protein [Labrys wisconsinensis]